MGQSYFPWKLPVCWTYPELGNVALLLLRLAYARRTRSDGSVGLPHIESFRKIWPSQVAELARTLCQNQWEMSQLDILPVIKWTSQHRGKKHQSKWWIVPAWPDGWFYPFTLHELEIAGDLLCMRHLLSWNLVVCWYQNNFEWIEDQNIYMVHTYMTSICGQTSRSDKKTGLPQYDVGLEMFTIPIH